MNGRAETKETVDQKVVDSVWWALRMSFGLVPFLAGLDKFFNLLTFWPKYVAPSIASVLPITPQSFMPGQSVRRSACDSQSRGAWPCVSFEPSVMLV